MILCLSPLVLTKPLAVPLAVSIGGVAISVLLVLRRSKIFTRLTR
jgi:hypothetical protein